MLSSCRWFSAIIALALSVYVNAQQQPPPPPAGAQRFTDATTKLIAAINADDQPAIQQMFSEVMQKTLPPEKTGPFFRGLLSAKGKLQAAGAPEVSGPAAKVRVTAERGDWRFEITLDPSGKIAGLLVLPGDDKPGRKEAPPAADGVPANEPSYLELRRSKDRLTQQLAQRYFNLVKMQEWTSANGKKVSAKYISHDPGLKWVKLAVRGSSRDRALKELPVDLSKLSKTSQSRVKQIATLQKKLDQLKAAETATGEPGQVEGGGLPGVDPGAPMIDERGNQPPSPDQPRGEYAQPPDPRVTPAEPGRGPPTTPVEGHDSPDPLGFAEISEPANLGQEAGGFPAAVTPAALPAGVVVAETGNTAPWQTSYDAFIQNITLKTAPNGEAVTDWGQLTELGELNRLTKLAGGPGYNPAKVKEIASKLGSVRWQLKFTSVKRSDERGTEVGFGVLLPHQPLKLRFLLDDPNTATEWSGLAVNTPVDVVGRLSIEEPNVITVRVRMAQPGDGPAGTAPTSSEGDVPGSAEIERR